LFFGDSGVVTCGLEFSRDSKTKVKQKFMSCLGIAYTYVGLHSNLHDYVLGFNPLKCRLDLNGTEQF